MDSMTMTIDVSEANRAVFARIDKECALDFAACEYKRIRAAIDALEEEKKALAEQIKGIMDYLRQDKVTTASGHNVSYTAISKTRLDTKAVQARYPAIADECSKATIETRLCVN